MVHSIDEQQADRLAICQSWKELPLYGVTPTRHNKTQHVFQKDICVWWKKIHVVEKIFGGSYVLRRKMCYYTVIHKQWLFLNGAGQLQISIKLIHTYMKFDIMKLDMHKLLLTVNKILV